MSIFIIYFHRRTICPKLAQLDRPRVQRLVTLWGFDLHCKNNKESGPYICYTYLRDCCKNTLSKRNHFKCLGTAMAKSERITHDFAKVITSHYIPYPWSVNYISSVQLIQHNSVRCFAQMKYRTLRVSIKQNTWKYGSQIWEFFCQRSSYFSEALHIVKIRSMESISLVNNDGAAKLGFWITFRYS